MKNLITHITEAFDNVSEALTFNGDQGNPSKISKEILEIVRKGFPSTILNNVESVEPNGYNAMSTGLNNGKSREYKTITLIFKTPVGKIKITELVIGLLKSTSGPGTGMVAISGSKNNNHVLFDKVSNYSYAAEFYDDAHESLTKLFNEHIKPLL